MPLIQNPSIARKLQRFLRLVDFPDSVLAPEVVPVILVEDLSPPLSDIERGCRGATSVGPVAAEFPLLVLVRAGAPARYDAKILEIHVSSDTDQEIRIIVPTAGVTGLAISGQTSFIDFEAIGRPTSQMGSDTQVAIPAGRQLFSWLALSSTLYRVPMNLRLGTIGVAGELTSVMIAGVTANTRIVGGFEWVEGETQG